MTCADARHLLDAYFDTELDLSASLEVERHLSECTVCSRDLRKLQLLREEFTPEVFDLAAESDLRPLRSSIRMVAGSRSPRSSNWTKPALALAAAAALVLAVLVPVRLVRVGTNAGREIIDSHVRSLMANHLVDVPSSDQHTVKPWFQGKLDFAPDVPNLLDQGFELVGARLDVIAGRPAAALVYKRRNHVLNMWISRADDGDEPPAFSTVNGYHVAHWRKLGMQYWAATDLNQTEFGSFVDLVRR